MHFSCTTLCTFIEVQHFWNTFCFNLVTKQSSQWIIEELRYFYWWSVKELRWEVKEKMFTGGYIESEKGRKIKRTETQRYKGISANRKRSSNQRETREVTLPPCGLLGYCPYIHKPCCFFHTCRHLWGYHAYTCSRCKWVKGHTKTSSWRLLIHDLNFLDSPNIFTLYLPWLSQGPYISKLYCPKLG